MMETFLGKIAGMIAAMPPDEISATCIVFPNRRSGLFLKKYLGTVVTKPVWSPGIFSIIDFVETLSGKRVADNLTLMLELYEAHKLASQKIMPYEDFVGWGELILKDFNDTDLYLADPKELFTHLTEAKAIAYWNPDGTPLTSIQQQYLEFFRSLYDVYLAFRERLEQKGLAYQGMLYRQVAENMPVAFRGIQSYSKVIFAGFNALNTAENRIIRELEPLVTTQTLWDGDKYYTQNPAQEAGRYFRQHKKDFSKDAFQWEFDYFKEREREISVIGVAGSTGQAKAAGNIIKELTGQGIQPGNIAVVLADENILIPMLNSIPDNVDRMNITMGYPLKTTMAAQYTGILLRLFSNAEKFSGLNNQSKARYYHKDLIPFMQHPYTRMLAAPEMNQVSFVAAVSAAFASTNRVFFTRDDILALSDFVAGCFSSVFPEIVPRTGQVIAICSEMFASIISNSKETADSIELGFLSSCVSMFNQFRSFFEQYQPDWNVSFFRKVLTTTMQGVRVPFSGEPLEGLQIMGMLESRGLDFENVILLSANEGILPTGKAHNSFIPLDIRQEFGLPAYREKDAIFAYHFYRLIQRAQKAFILYNTDISDGMKTGEKSRFITQILHELPRYNKDISIKESFIHAFPGEIGGTRIEEVAKTPEILAKINQIEQKGYSPTSLSTYLRCNLRFYYSYILGIQEVAEIEETMDAATVGTIVHQVLETLYGSFGNTALTAAALRDAKKGISEQIESAIAEHYPGGDIAFGKNLLLRKIAEKALREFLEAEATYIEDTKATIEIRELERKLIAALQVGDVQVNIRGTVDRIDACNGNIRILDYKTGKVDPLSLKVSSITPEKKIEDFEKAFQLMVYCWMFDKTDNTQASAGIISFRNPSKYVLPLLTDTPGNRVTPESLDSLEQMLFELVSEIRNPSQPFLPTTESRRCSYCPYTALCGLVGTT